MSFMSPLWRPWVPCFLFWQERHKVYIRWIFSSPHSYRSQTAPWLGKQLSDEAKWKPIRITPLTLWLTGVLFMATLPGSTGFPLKFSPIFLLLCCVVLQLGSTLRENLQKKTNMEHLPSCKLLSPSFKSLWQSTRFWLIFSFHVVDFCILSIVFSCISMREAVVGLLIVARTGHL